MCGWYFDMEELYEESEREELKMKLEKKIEAITDSFSDIMIELGLDTTDDSLMDTPKRVAKMYVNEIFYGLNYDYFPKCTAIENKMKTNGSFLLEKNINVQSILDIRIHFFILWLYFFFSYL